VYIGLFKRTYPIRNYGGQVITDGYQSVEYADGAARLNVQPLSPDELLALPEGERTVKRVKTFGPDKFNSADEFTGTPATRLFYGGQWYECKSSVMWDHTILAHYRSEFVILPQFDQEAEPEVTDP
jgi:hypothetical protein